MRNFLVSAILVGAAAITAAPATAHVYDRGYDQGRIHQPSGRTFASDLARIGTRVRALAGQGRLAPREADRLLYEVDRLGRLSERYRRDGVNRWEHRELQQRLAALRQRARFTLADGRWDADGRGDDAYEGERWNASGEEDGRWDGDEDNDRWDDRDEDDNDWEGEDELDERWDNDDRPD